MYICSGVEHQKADWLGIHEKICQLLIPLRTPVPFHSSEEERVHRAEQLRMRQVCVQVVIKLLHLLSLSFQIFIRGIFLTGS